MPISSELQGPASEAGLRGWSAACWRSEEARLLWLLSEACS